MFKVMLVDDEKNIIEMLKRIVDWSSLGFTIQCEAYNGKCALEHMESYHPDLAVVDINMPFIDGMEFAQIIKEKYQETKVIFLTGYNDFRYAKKAVNIGVYYYILKPVEKAELEEVLGKLRMELENRKGMEVLKSKVDLSDRILREKFINDLITGQMLLSDEELILKFEEYNISLIGERFRVIAIEMDRAVELYSRENDKKYAVDNILEVGNNVFADIGNFISYATADGRVFILAGESAKNLKKHENLLTLCEKIRLELFEIRQFSVTIGYGSSYEGRNNIYKSYTEALSALRYKFILGNNKVINYNSIEFSNTRKDYCNEKTRNDIQFYLRQGNYVGLEKMVGSMFDAAKIKLVSIEYTQMVCVELVLIGISFLNENDVRLQDVLERYINPLDEVKRKETIDDAKVWVLELYRRGMEYINSNRISGGKKLVDKAAKIIESSLGNSELSVTHIANELHVNEDYLSSLFKKEFGIPMAKFIASCRLRKAKEYMDTGWCNIGHLSEKVGFDDQNYFSKCFKKYYGVTPSKYIEGKQ